MDSSTDNTRHPARMFTEFMGSVNPVRRRFVQPYEYATPTVRNSA
jgi:hypothetical protein